MDYPFSAPNGYEERLNRQFAGFLFYSLQFGPELLNRIHNRSDLTFSADARVVGHQDSPLPLYADTETNREIDWVVGDEDKLVGYESKYGDSLHTQQLRDELEKLRRNADGRAVRLVAVTPHTTPPSVINRFDDDPVDWLSWNTIARRIAQTTEDDLQAEQQSILRMLQDLFAAEDMHPFTGFDHQEKLQYRYFIRDLRQELIDTDLENPGKINSSTTQSSEPASWKRLVPKRLDIPFVRESREDDWSRLSSYLTATVNTETHEVHAGIVFNVREVKAHREFVDANVDALVEYATDRDLEMWASMNSFNQWEYGVPSTNSPREMRQWLQDGSENVIRADEIDFKKAIFVRQCAGSSPADLVNETTAQLQPFFEDFLIDDELYPWPTLAPPEQGSA